MAKLRVPTDLLEGYAWMRRTVLGLEDQSIPVLTLPAYGANEIIPLTLVHGWTTGSTGGHPPVMVSIADHTLLMGSVKWHRGTSGRAVLLPPGIAPFEEYSFITYRDDSTKITIRASPKGFLYIPDGNKSVVQFCIRYPAPRGGE